MGSGEKNLDEYSISSRQNASPFYLEDIDDNLIRPEERKKVPQYISSKAEEIGKVISEKPDICVEKRNVKYDYDEIKNLLLTEKFNPIWEFLKYSTTIRGNKPSDNCAIYYYGKYLKHDYQNKLLFKNNLPAGWNCKSDPFNLTCVFQPYKSPKDRFIRWVELLNDGYINYALNLSDFGIKKNTPEKEIKNQLGWKYDFLYSENNQKAYVSKMNEIGSQVILERYAKGRRSASIKNIRGIIKELELEKKAKDLELEVSTKEKVLKRPPLKFTPEILLKKALVKNEEDKITEFDYLIKSYSVDQKKSLINSGTIDEAKIKILNSYTDLSKEKEKKLDEERIVINQVEELGNFIKKSIEKIASENNLCGSPRKDAEKIWNKGFFNPDESVKKKKANHFNFSASTCVFDPVKLRQFNVTPLFKAWVNPHSLNEKLYEITDFKGFITEYEYPTKDTSSAQLIQAGRRKTTRKLAFTEPKQILYADNTPVIFELSTGKSMIPNYLKEFKKEDYIEEIESTTLLSTFKTNSYKTIKFGTEKEMKEKIFKENNFHACTQGIINATEKESKINGISAVPFSVTTKNLSVKNKKTGKVIRNEKGISINWAIAPENFEEQHIGIIFNYKYGLNELEKFIEKGYKLEDQILKKCN